jgi:hypothetical protein
MQPHSPDGRNPRRACLALVALAATLGALALGSSTASAQATAYDSTATLLWTAPGDDGSTGVAAQYDLRYSPNAIAGTDTLAWWNAATRVTNLPAPRPAGSVDSVQVRGLTPSRTYFFILRTADEVPNWSNFSNVAIRLPYSDVIAPIVISDLEILSSSASPHLPGSSTIVAPAGAATRRRD